MKFLKTFLGLFFVLFIPLMILVGVFVHPRNMTTGQALLGAAFPIGTILLILSLGFAFVSGLMDGSKPK